MDSRRTRGAGSRSSKKFSNRYLRHLPSPPMSTWCWMEGRSTSSARAAGKPGRSLPAKAAESGLAADSTGAEARCSNARLRTARSTSSGIFIRFIL